MRQAIHGIVLAGGESRRLGRDKALVRLGGLRLVDRAVRCLAPQVAALAVSRHDGELEGAGPELTVLGDPFAERSGPLGGLLAGLDWVARRDLAATHAVTVAVDTPFLPGDLVARLAAAREAAGAEACVAASGARRHAVVALWPVAARHALRAGLEAGGPRRVGAVLDGLRCAVARWPDGPLDPFFNINTPDDLAAAERLLAGSVL